MTNEHECTDLNSDAYTGSVSIGETTYPVNPIVVAAIEVLIVDRDTSRAAMGKLMDQVDRDGETIRGLHAEIERLTENAPVTLGEARMAAWVEAENGRLCGEVEMLRAEIERLTPTTFCLTCVGVAGWYCTDPGHERTTTTRTKTLAPVDPGADAPYVMSGVQARAWAKGWDALHAILTESNDAQ